MRIGISLLAALVVSIAAPAAAQLRRDSSGAWLPPASYAASDDALSVSLNPASIAHQDTWSLHYSHADSGDAERFAERGDALYGSIPLLFGIAIGAGVDSVRPSASAIAAGAIERTMVSLALGLRLSDQLSIGAAPRVLFSGDRRLYGVFTLDVAANWRPLPELAVAFIARDLTGPGYQGGGGSIPRSFLLSGAIRPDGTRAFTLDLMAGVDDRGRVAMRAMAELEVPFFGRLLAAGEVEDVGGADPDVRVTVGASLDWAEYGVGGGVVVGDGFEAWPGWYVTGHIEGERRRGLPTGDVIAEITSEGVGPRGLLRLEARFERALRDPRVRGVLWRPRGGMGLAAAQEMRLLIAQLEDAGKHVVCYLEDASGSELYACAGASSIVGDPAGGIRMYGPALEIQHYAGLLRELDIRADFVRIGRFKSAIEDFHDDHMSAGAREARETIMDDLYGRFVSDLSRDFSMDEARAAEVVAGGPYVAPAAVEAGLVDHLSDFHDLSEILEEVYGGSYAREHAEPDEADRHFGHQARVGVVVIDGEMVDGENMDLPILEIHTTGGRTAVDAIDALARDPAISAIVIRLDTPGGSVLAADQIWRAIQRARERVPVIASMGSVAASGGYYVASGCDEIWADPATMTGSIGVWFGKVDFEPLATRFGVVTEEISRTPRANAETLFAPFTPDERAVLAEAVRHWYREFLRRVAAGRNMTLTEVHAVAQGRVWTGDRALEIGLVDRLGGFQSALMRARQLGGLPGDAPFEVRPSRPSTLIDYVLGEVNIFGGSEMSVEDALTDPSAADDPTGLSSTLSHLAPEVLSALRFTVLMRGASSSTPMALWPVDTRVVP